eukprot:scaffold137727_cov35-Tisochrysis_lutea.AAC.3
MGEGALGKDRDPTKRAECRANYRRRRLTSRGTIWSMSPGRVMVEAQDAHPAPARFRRAGARFPSKPPVEARAQSNA